MCVNNSGTVAGLTCHCSIQQTFASSGASGVFTSDLFGTGFSQIQSSADQWAGNKTAGEPENWRTRQLEDQRVTGPEGWRTRQLEDQRAGGPDSWRIRGLEDQNLEKGWRTRKLEDQRAEDQSA